MKRRGELSMEVIIIAAIALLVLVILTILIIRSGTGVASGTSCAGISGAQCTPDGSCDSGYIRSAHTCSGEGEICCIPISNGE